MRILFIGDVVGRPGRQAIEERLGELRKELAVDFCVLNGENAADGLGITPKLADRLLAAGADVITLGNHTWRRSEIGPYLAASARDAIVRRAPLMRPLFLDHPDDPAIWDHPLQWMLGPSLLVAPVTAPGAESVVAYLPPGTWRDAFTGETVAGGRALERPTALEDAAVWVRGADWSRLRVIFGD